MYVWWQSRRLISAFRWLVSQRCYHSTPIRVSGGVRRRRTGLESLNMKCMHDITELPLVSFVLLKHNSDAEMRERNSLVPASFPLVLFLLFSIFPHFPFLFLAPLCFGFCTFLFMFDTLHNQNTARTWTWKNESRHLFLPPTRTQHGHKHGITWLIFCFEPSERIPVVTWTDQANHCFLWHTIAQPGYRIDMNQWRHHNATRTKTWKDEAKFIPSLTYQNIIRT